jgi:hypothetical protein
MTHNVFGPVPSRRLGRPLGVDLVPFKTCTYDWTRQGFCGLVSGLMIKAYPEASASGPVARLSLAIRATVVLDCVRCRPQVSGETQG